VAVVALQESYLLLFSFAFLENAEFFPACVKFLLIYVSIMLMSTYEDVK